MRSREPTSGREPCRDGGLDATPHGVLTVPPMKLPWTRRKLSPPPEGHADFWAMVDVRLHTPVEIHDDDDGVTVAIGYIRNFGVRARAGSIRNARVNRRSVSSTRRTRQRAARLRGWSTRSKLSNMTWLGHDAMNQFEPPANPLPDGEIVPIDLTPGLLVINSIGTPRSLPVGGSQMARELAPCSSCFCSYPSSRSRSTSSETHLRADTT